MKNTKCQFGMRVIFTDCCPIYKFVKLSIIYLCNFNEFGSSTSCIKIGFCFVANS